jgi:tetratricopeptide (TPR) repeat protein
MLASTRRDVIGQAGQRERNWRTGWGRAVVTVDREFFLSFTGADRPWAEWLLAELDTAGYSSVSQLRDFVAGGNFALDMDNAARRAKRTLGVLSARAMQAPYVRQEWAQRLAADPTGEQRSLVLVRVEPCEPEGMLRPVVYIDLVGLDEASARERLRDELAAVLRGQRLQTGTGRYPGGGSAAEVAGVRRPRFPTALPPVWNVPHRRNPLFTGRERALAMLAEQLRQGTAAAVTQAIQGGGGIGKTALAAEYAYRHRSEFDAVWWVRAQEPATLVGDYASLAGAQGLPEGTQADQQLGALAARRWLDTNERWLLVLDNAEAPHTATGLLAPLARLVDLIPPVLHGQVLVTTRDAGWEDLAELAELDVLDPPDAVRFLLERTATTGTIDTSAAEEIAELLGYLPLALEQAGAYMREARIGLAAYRDRLRQFPVLTLARGRPRDRDPNDTVATTWQVSLERVRPTPGAVGLLEVCAFLGPEEIPRELFGQRLDPPAEGLEVLAEDPFALDDAIAALRRFALVKADEQALSMHRLLQQIVRDRLDPPPTGAARVGVAVRLLDQGLPFGGYADPGLWPVCARLLPHALAATEHATQLEVEPLSAAALLESAADYLHGRARYADARALHERALSIYEARLGADHPTTAVSLNNLADVLRAQGDLDGARRLHERALQIREARLGADHPATARSRQRLAEVVAALEEKA